MYLVCDGGGTKTEYMLFDLSGHIHGFSKTQGTNAIFINPDAAADAVCGGISDCLQQAGIRDTDVFLCIPCILFVTSSSCGYIRLIIGQIGIQDFNAVLRYRIIGVYKHDVLATCCFNTRIPCSRYTSIILMNHFYSIIFEFIFITYFSRLIRTFIIY